VAIKCATITPGTFDSCVDAICTLNLYYYIKAVRG
jgi:hypothetical protein